MTKVNPNHENETKSEVFLQDKFKSGITSIGHKMLKKFNDFYDWHLSISFQK